MVMDEKMRMDHEAVRSAGLDMANLGVSFQSMRDYARGGGDLKVEHFGGTSEGYNAYMSFNAAVQKLAESVEKAHQYCTQAGQRLTDSANSTTTTDVDNAWGLTRSGGK